MSTTERERIAGAAGARNGAARSYDAAGILAAAIAARPVLRAEADIGEERRTLTPVVLKTLRAAGVFRMTTARERGGPGLTPREQFEVLEAISIADGSAGWCAYINSTSGFFTAYLDEDVAAEMFANLDTPVAGMPVPIGRADRVAGGYRISGHWAFGSGILHSGWVMCGCRVYADGAPVMRPDGTPEVIAGIVPADDVEVIDNWDTLGLRGTGSHDFTVTNAFVPIERSFDNYTDPVRVDAPLYRFAPMFLFNQTAVGIGIARAAIDAFTEVARSKTTPGGPLHEQGYARMAIAEAHAMLASARAFCLSIIDEISATLERGEMPTLEQRATFRIAMTHTLRACAAAVDRVFTAAGTTAAVRHGTVLERCFRDVHTAGSHLSLSPLTYDVTGAMLLGTPPPAGMPSF